MASVAAHAVLIAWLSSYRQYPLAQAVLTLEVRIVPAAATGIANTESVVEATDSVLSGSSDLSRTATTQTSAIPASHPQASQSEETHATSQRQVGVAPVVMMEELLIATQASLPSNTIYYADSEVDAMPIALDPIVPRYPPNTDDATDGGKVTLRLLIDAAGVVEDVAVLETQLPEPFKESARSALLTTRFKPAEKDGKAVGCQMLLSIAYAATPTVD